jgi:putative tryptophan/tyrosine transport system substrate-binding protein
LLESWGPTPPIVGLRDGLEKLGYREDQDFYLGVRFTQGDRAALPAAAQDLIEAGAALLFTESNGTAKAAQQVTSQIPIVFAGVEDPVGAGLVQSFARPAGNITGVASLDIELGPKRLQMFYRLVPSLKRVLFLYAAHDIYSRQAAVLYRSAARQLSLQLVEKRVHTQAEVLATLSALRELHIDGVLTPRCCALNIPGLVLAASNRDHIPSIHVNRTFWVEQGDGFAAFGTNHYVLGFKAARIVDKIIKGEKPADIAVEADSTIEFTVNLKRARAMGLTIDPRVLYQADYVIR